MPLVLGKDLDQVPSTYRSELKRYLLEDDDMAIVVTKLTAPMHAYLASGNDSRATDAAAGLWQIFINIVANTPHDSPSHEKLVSLLAAIKQLSAPAEHRDRAEKLGLWQDLPLFKAELEEYWDFHRCETTEETEKIPQGRFGGRQTSSLT